MVCNFWTPYFFFSLYNLIAKGSEDHMITDDKKFLTVITINGKKKEEVVNNIYDFLKILLSSQGIYESCKNKYGKYAIEFKDIRNRKIIVKSIKGLNTNDLYYDYKLEDPFISKNIKRCFMKCLSGFSPLAI